MVKRRFQVVDALARRAVWCAVLVGVLQLSGCGPSGPVTYPVSGTVTYNGQYLPDGYITFTPLDASQAPDSGEIKAGRFEFRATAGPKKVEIQASRFVGPENPVMGLRPREQYIPERYNIDSELTAEVTPDGENEFQFPLKGDDAEEE